MTTSTTPRFSALTAAAAAAASLPSLLAYNPAPSPTFLNQALAIGAWGVWATLASGRGRDARLGALVLAALALLGVGVVWSWGPGALPSSLAWSGLGMLAAAAVLAASGASAGARPDGESIAAAFFAGWVIAGLLNAGIALLQVFAPDLTDGDFLARSGYPGRAVGNLRQPNHLSSLAVWAAIGVIALLQLGRLRAWPARLVFALLTGVVVLTASRTGLVSVVLLAAWGLLDRSLARDTRRLLAAAPLLYGLAWSAMWWWAQHSHRAFGGQDRLQETDISSSRFGIWGNTLDLIARHPWTGVGFGEFNLAWSMTPFPGRPTAFFDHAHNLPLHIAAELGLPMAGAVMALLLWALVRGWGWGRPAAPAARCAWVFVLMIGLHSLLEYPLWYAYFLLPTAWAWGLTLGSPARPASGQGTANQPGSSGTATPPWAVAAGLALVIGSAASALDYTRVTRIFDSGGRGDPLAQRIETGRASVLFSHHADYAAATTGLPQADGLGAYDGAKHYLLDTRFMAAWAQALADNGQTEAARHIAARLREFGVTRSEAFFAACSEPASAARSFQCQPPGSAVDWRVLALESLSLADETPAGSPAGSPAESQGSAPAKAR